MIKSNTTNTTNTINVIEQFEKLHISHNHNCKEYNNALNSLSQMIVYSTLNKTIDPQRKKQNMQHVSNNGYNTQVVALKNSLYHDISILDNIETSQSNSEKDIINSKGDVQKVISDRTLHDGFTKILGENITDAYDLIQTAKLEILEQCHSDKVDDTQVGFMEAPYSYVTLSKRVVIKKDDSKAQKEIVTTPIQQVYRKVSQYIRDNKSLQIDPHNMYTYIELSTDNTDSASDRQYRRLEKFSDLGGYTTSDIFNCTPLYTADNSTIDNIETLIEKLELTARQAQVLNLRLKGCGNTAIASYLGVSLHAIEKTQQAIQKKAISKLDISEKAIKKMDRYKYDSKKKLTDTQEDNILLLFNAGNSKTFLSNKYNVSRVVINKAISNAQKREEEKKKNIK
jgi:DNA-binding CsgD family transcriptional regulator